MPWHSPLAVYKQKWQTLSLALLAAAFQLCGLTMTYLRYFNSSSTRSIVHALTFKSFLYDFFADLGGQIFKSDEAFQVIIVLDKT